METKILNFSEENIQLLVESLEKDQVVGVPTETVYGLAGVGISELAMQRIFEAKERPLFDPLILHIVKQDESLSNYEALIKSGLVDLSGLDKAALAKIEKLANTFWPGPLTMALPKTKAVPDLATSGLNTVAIRMPAHPSFQALLKKLGKPLAAPSANRFGRISPTKASHVYSELNGRIPYILEGGDCNLGVESTIIGLEETGNFALYRPGSLALEAVEELLGEKLSRSLHSEKPVAPGMLKSHYAPKKPFHLIPGSISNWPESVWNEIRAQIKNSSVIGLLIANSKIEEVKNYLKEKDLALDSFHIHILSTNNDSIEGAKNLFSHLRLLDADNSTHIYAETWPSTNALGFAIIDRMNRAAAK